ncbi:MAG TPA: LamG-like jellyroll fold domain-containing protein, partial [Lentimicrobium sp.]|nr:LamG-like jellyroll fold domain-containing protein [Lentimicrobium sp.]
GATGGTGNSSNGNGGDGSNNGANGNPGQIYGGGGAGARTTSGTDRAGGNGAAGRVIISWVVLEISTTTTATCEGSNDGTITASASGGTLPYQYKLNNNPYQQSNVFTGLAAGTYTVTVKDANGITKSTQAVIASIPASMPTPTADVINATCNSADGAITVTNIPTSIHFTKTESEYIDLQSGLLNNLNRFTLEGWIKINKSEISGSRTWGLMGQNDAIEFGIMDNTTLQLWSSAGGTLNVPMSSYPDDNEWHHVAAVGNGSQMAIYIDGNLAGSLNSTVSNYGSSIYHTVIGGHVWDATGNYLNGSFLKAGFWSRAFTQQEIQSLLNSKFRQYDENETGLISGFNFFEGTGDIITGIGSATTEGTLINSPDWVEVFTYQWLKTGNPAFSETTKNISQIDDGEYSFSAFFEGICPATGTWTIYATGNNIWTGIADNNWNNVSNWTCNIPTIDDDATIPSGLSRYPLLSTGNDGTVKNLIINSGASVTINGKKLQIAGSITSNGTFDCTSGTIEMKGSSSQVIPAGCFVNNTIARLIVNNTSNVSLNGTLNITETVRVQSGNLITNNDLVLRSDFSKSALVEGSGSGNINGEVTMDRFIPSAFGYKYFSSAFSDAHVSQFSGDVDLNSSFPSFWTYDETNEATGWEAYTDPGSLLIAGKGYAANFGSAGGERIVHTAGTVNNGNVTIELTNNNNPYTQGFNLIGNPYPSPIDWDAAGWIKQNIDNAVYYFDAGITDQYVGTYSSYIHGISSDGTAGPVIPSQQGFFVHVSDGSYPVQGSITFNNAIRVNDLNPVFHKNSATLNPLIRLSARYNDKSKADYLVIYMLTGAPAEFNTETDALKIQNTDPGVPNIYSISADQKNVSIKALAHSDTQVIPLILSSPVASRIYISAADIKELEGFNVYLKDNGTGTITDLRREAGYAFDAGNETISDRFKVIITKETLENEAFGNASFKTFCDAGSIYIDLKLKEEQVTVQLTDLSGRQLISKSVYGEGKHCLGRVPQAGVGIVSIQTETGTASQKILLSR